MLALPALQGFLADPPGSTHTQPGHLIHQLVGSGATDLEALLDVLGLQVALHPDLLGSGSPWATQVWQVARQAPS